jgi:hypothetical protein
VSDFPGRPAVQKGELLIYDSQQPGARPSSRIIFQYNPESVRRTFAVRQPPAQPAGSANARQDVLRVPGPPVETISMTVVLDAADQVGDSASAGKLRDGLLPVLAAIELLLYPSTSSINRNQQQTDQGEVQVQPGDVPLVMLAWGVRLAPVLITNFSITESQFDPFLNPIQAQVELGMRVLTHMEFTRESAGREAYLNYQQKKESLARQARSAP